MIPTTFVSVSFLYEAAEKGEEKKERKKEERTQVKTMAYRVAFGACKACGARNTGVPKNGNYFFLCGAKKRWEPRTKNGNHPKSTRPNPCHMTNILTKFGCNRIKRF